MKKNIVLNQFTTLNNYFIDENGTITDENGAVKHPRIHHGRLVFKDQMVHKIMMNTFNEYRDGHKWHIHHIDKNPLNNKLENLIYLTKSEHMKFHHNNRSEETIQKMSDSHKGKKLTEDHKHKISENNGRYWLGKHPSSHFKGKHHSTESKRKISEARKRYFANKNK